MRNEKLLWGMIGCVLTAVMMLIVFFLWETFGEPDQVAPSPSPTGTERSLARIGSVEIKDSVFREQLRRKYGPELLGQMIDREAIRLEGDKQGIKVTRDDIDTELKRMQQGYDSEQAFYESMRNQLGLTKDEIREDVYYKLLLEKVATKDITVTDKQIDDYIKTHPEEFHLTEQLRIEYILNKTLEQAKRTIELYKAGGDFNRLARERSLDTATASEGGDLGWVEDNDPFVPHEILQAARQLKPGQLSGPIETAEGYAVIRLRDRKERSKENPVEVRESVRKMLSLQQAPPLQDVVRQLRASYNAQILDPDLKP